MAKATDIKKAIEVPESLHQPMAPTSYPKMIVSCSTNIGSRRYQEDRFAICPALVKGRDDCAFFGVFDGTVGDFASDNVKDLVIPHLVNSPAWQAAEAKIKAAGSDADLQGVPDLLAQAMRDMYKNADAELIEMCREKAKHFASTTSVTVLVAGGFCCVGHLGDSRVALGGETSSGKLVGESLTLDHKPDQPEERKRIESSGGSVEYLHNHNNKPFIRGGDFTVRKAAGEQPMQLQYSRAFGGKDLKPFGLSSEPDIKVFRVAPTHKVLILASDGIWDVLTAEQTVHIALAAAREGQSPAETIVRVVLNEQRNGNADNLTCIAVQLKH